LREVSSLVRDHNELSGWIHANRHIRDLACDERVQYRVEPLCNAEGVAPATVP